MSEQAASTPPYRVIPSTRVIDDLQALIRRAYVAGYGAQALAALKEIERRLSIYPQFGERLMDLHHTGETLWVATIPPLVVRYVIDDGIRAVFIGTPFMPLPNAGFK